MDTTVIGQEEIEGMLTYDYIVRGRGVYHEVPMIMPTYDHLCVFLQPDRGI